MARCIFLPPPPLLLLLVCAVPAVRGVLNNASTPLHSVEVYNSAEFTAAWVNPNVNGVQDVGWLHVHPALNRLEVMARTLARIGTAVHALPRAFLDMLPLMPFRVAADIVMMNDIQLQHVSVAPGLLTGLRQK
jgi:hypothetical protein